MLYGKRGKYKDAEPLCKRALEIREKVLGSGNLLCSLQPPFPRPPPSIGKWPDYFFTWIAFLKVAPPLVNVYLLHLLLLISSLTIQPTYELKFCNSV